MFLSVYMCLSACLPASLSISVALLLSFKRMSYSSYPVSMMYHTSDVSRLTDHDVILENGFVFERCDVIVACTGWWFLLLAFILA